LRTDRPATCILTSRSPPGWSATGGSLTQGATASHCKRHAFQVPTKALWRDRAPRAQSSRSQTVASGPDFELGNQSAGCRLRAW